jgi:hypothetical protein
MKDGRYLFIRSFKKENLLIPVDPLIQVYPIIWNNPFSRLSSTKQSKKPKSSQPATQPKKATWRKIRIHEQFLVSPVFLNKYLARFGHLCKYQFREWCRSNSTLLRQFIKKNLSHQIFEDLWQTLGYFLMNRYEVMK